MIKYTKDDIEEISKKYKSQTIETNLIIEDQVTLLMMLIEHHYNIEFNYRDVFDAYFKYTEKLFDDIEDKSVIWLDEMIGILIDCINGKI